MVKIRYLDLPAGLHVSAEKRGRTTVLYLLPGLTAEQRRAAIARARSSGRMGLGPELPPVSLAMALAADRVRSTVRNGLTATRGHPVVLLPGLILVVSSAIVFMVVSFVTVTAPHTQSWLDPFGPGGGRRIHSGDGPSVTSGGGSQGRPSPSPGPSQSATVDPGQLGPRPATIAPSPSPSSLPALSPSPPTPSPSPSSSPSSSPPSSSSPSPAASCVKLGPLGLCVSL